MGAMGRDGQMQELIKKPRTKKGVETLNKILSAAAQEFYEKGYHGANIKDIAKLAGVATGTFYIYFDGKYNLYKYLLLHCSHQIRRHLHEATRDCKTRREVEAVGMKSWLEFVLQNQYMYNIIWESLYVDRALFMDYYVNFGASYAKGLNKARQNGETQDIDSDVLSYILMGASSFLGFFADELKERGLDTDRIVTEYMKLLDHGMLAGTLPPAAAQKAEEPAAPGMRFRVELDDDFFESYSKK